MKFVRDLWAESFRLDDTPHWPCPVCERGGLLLQNETLRIYETKKSLARRSEEDWDNWDIEKHFSVVFHCSNPKCKEPVFVVGECKSDQELTAFLEGRKNDFSDHLYPRFTQPRLKIVNEGYEIPIDVILQLERVNSLFWTDKDACANAIRTVVEEILTQQRIRKTYQAKSGSKQKLTLHARIQNFRLKDEVVAELLEAIKWIGNSGSHSSGIDHDELLDGMSVLSRALELLYPNGDESAEEIAESINRRNRGKPKKPKTKS